MSLINDNRSFIRILALLLFIVSLMGPWMFDKLNVPAQYACNRPSIRLYGDFCGYPMSGFLVFLWVFGGLFNIASEWIRGNFIGQGYEFIIMIYALVIFLPIFSTILFLWKKESHQRHSINLFLWGLACIPLVHYLFVLSQSRNQILHVWGLWLYLATAIGTIIFELLLLRSNTAPGMDSKQP